MALSKSVLQTLQRVKVEKSESNAVKLKNLIRAFEARKLVFVMGAGVSLPYGLPDWNTLLQRLLLSIQVGETDAAEFFAGVLRPNPLVAARFIRNHFRRPPGERSPKFEAAVRQVLYEGIRERYQSPLMRELCALILAPAGSPMLDSVISYNFDDILETSLRELGERIGIQIPFRPIFSPGQPLQPNELPIYHVHGYLPRTGELSPEHYITLGESDYHQQYIKQYSWENLVQVNAFINSTCFFIGTSFTDPNLRRLLDIAREHYKDEGVRHYLVRKIPSAEAMAAQLRGTPARAGLKKSEIEAAAQKMSAMQMNFEENDAHSFGVEVIWIHDYDEIPAIVRSIRKRQVLESAPKAQPPTAAGRARP